MKSALKTLVSSLLCISLAMCGFDFSASAIFGDGTKDNPYLISTIEQLQAIPSTGLSSHYKLIKNLDLSSIDSWSPIGSKSKPFTGTFDGNSYTLSGLNLTDTETLSDFGLFGYIYNATVKNVSVVVAFDGKSTTEIYNVASVAGECINSTLNNCHASGKIWTAKGIAQSIGGLIGYSGYSSIENCSTAVDIWVYKAQYVGGITGSSSYSTVNMCSSSGEVMTLPENSTGDYYSYSTGGITGTVLGNCTIVNSYSTGSFYLGAAKHTEMYRQSDNLGGIVGTAYDKNKVINCYSLSTLSAQNYIGGIIGYAYTVNGYCTLVNNYYHGSLSTDSYTESEDLAYGNMIAYGTGSLTSCYMWEWASNVEPTDATVMSGADMQGATLVIALNSSRLTNKLTYASNWNIDSTLNSKLPFIETPTSTFVNYSNPKAEYSINDTGLISISAESEESGIAEIDLPDYSTVYTTTTTYQLDDSPVVFSVTDGSGLVTYRKVTPTDNDLSSWYYTVTQYGDFYEINVYAESATLITLPSSTEVKSTHTFFMASANTDYTFKITLTNGAIVSKTINISDE
jgi:hypothetical protein